MEDDLKEHLLTCAASYCAATGLADSTVGRVVTADGRFFERLRDGKTFTVKKYDDVIRWFSANWPDAVVWPDNVPKPKADINTNEDGVAVMPPSSHAVLAATTDKSVVKVGHPVGELTGGAQ